jgi:hypothetical protein
MRLTAWRTVLAVGVLVAFAEAATPTPSQGVLLLALLLVLAALLALADLRGEQ